MDGGEVCHAHSGAKVGRPSVLTPGVHERLVRAKSVGTPDWAAAQMVGISETTYYELLRRGRDEESGPHRELVVALERAEAEHYTYALATWKQAMAGDWRAGKAYTERVDRRRGRAEQAGQGVTGEAEGERVDPATLPDDILAFLADPPSQEKAE
jgi:hypothetical protein